MPAKPPKKGRNKAPQKRANKTPSPKTSAARKPARAPQKPSEDASEAAPPSQMPEDLAKAAVTMGPAAIIESAGAMIEDTKERLEYQLAGKYATASVAGKTITFKEWGLRKRISLGSRVSTLLSRLQTIMPDLGPEPDPASVEAASSMMMSALGVFVDDVVEIIAQSISDPFGSVSLAIEWIDDNCQLNDVIDMAIIVYDQNLAGEQLKNLQTGLESVSTRLQARFLKK